MRFGGIYYAAIRMGSQGIDDQRPKDAHLTLEPFGFSVPFGYRSSGNLPKNAGDYDDKGSFGVTSDGTQKGWA